jgi:hypothetical protein
VPIGIASQAGYGVVVAGLIAAVLSYVTGDHSQAQLGSIVSASVAVFSLAITQIGRYVQANSQIRANGELQKAAAAVTPVWHGLEQLDPNARAQLDMLVRQAIQGELSKLQVPADVEADVEDRLLPTTGETDQLLPTASEEAADQPPTPSAAADSATTAAPSAASPAGAR